MCFTVTEAENNWSVNVLGVPVYELLMKIKENIWETQDGFRSVAFSLERDQNRMWKPTSESP